MGRKHIVNNFIMGSRKADMPLISQSYTQNLVLETVGQDAPSQAVLRSIPGLTTFLEIPGTPRGRFVASKGPDGLPRLFVCFDNVVYCVDRLSGKWQAVEVGMVNGGTAPVHMCETGGARQPMLVVADGTSIHICETDAPSADIAQTWRNINLPKREDGESYIRPTHVTYQAGYLTINDEGTDNFYVSYYEPFQVVDRTGRILYDVFTQGRVWNDKENRYDQYPTGRWTKSDWVPDNTTAMISTGGVLYTMGPRSLQRFKGTDDDNKPFTSPDTSAMNIGLLAVNSLASIGADIYFLGASDVGQFGIYRANASECERISVPEMERCISQFKTPHDAVGFTWTENTHVFYAITFQGDDTTYVYDASNGTWANRVSTNTIDNTDHAWRYSYSTLFDNRIMFLTYGAIVFEDYTKWTEHDGRPIIRLRRGGALVNGGTPFFIDNVVFLLSNGYGNRLDPSVRPRVMFRYSGNGTTMSNERVGYMGRQGEYNYMTVFTRCGYCPSVFNMELSCSEDCDLAILKCAVNETAGFRGF